MAQPIGYFTFVLHSHLPYVISHGKWPHGMDWLDEAAIATYIPLLNVFNRLKDKGIIRKADKHDVSGEKKFVEDLIQRAEIKLLQK